MIEFSVVDASNQTLHAVNLSDHVFGCPVRGDLLTRVVHYQLAKRRTGTASTKRRSEVHGGGRKPYRQKGTGNARQGTTRAPQFRTGGVVFGPHPRDFAVKMNKKERQLGLRTALSAKREAGEMIVLGEFGLVGIKTKPMLEILTRLNAARSALVVLHEADMLVELSARNLPGITVMQVEGVNVYDLLVHEKLILTEAALAKLEARLNPVKDAAVIGEGKAA
ncbi:MAG: 50S ribosomal protein L4 [Magnetococcales bacterium]|nr:50S ribosomal protein L4 [Magnetococcales bacterium]